MFKSIVIMLNVVIYVLAVCDSVPITVNKIEECNLGVCRTKTHSLFKVNIGSSDYSCVNFMHGSSIVKTISMRASDVELTAGLSYMYTAMSVKGELFEKHCSCKGVFGQDYVPTYTCPENKKCIIKDKKEYQLSRWGGCVLDGDIFTRVSMGYEFVPSYNVYKMDDWFKKVVFEERIGNGNYTYDFSTWTSSDGHLFKSNKDFQVDNVIKESIDVKNLSNMVLIVDFFKPWLKYVVSVDKVNEVNEFNENKFGYFKRIDGVVKGEEKLRDILKITVGDCAKQDIVTYFSEPRYLLSQTLSSYLGAHTRMNIPNHYASNDVELNNHLFRTNSDDLLEDHGEYVLFFDPIAGSVKKLFNEKSGCSFKVGSSGKIEIVPFIDVLTCNDNIGNIRRISFNENCHLHWAWDDSSGPVSWTEPYNQTVISVKAHSGNCTNINVTAGVGFASADFVSSLDYSGGALHMEYDGDAAWLLDISTSYEIKYDSDKKVKPHIENCYIDRENNTLNIAVRNTLGTCGDVLAVASKPVIKSSHHEICASNTHVIVPIVKTSNVGDVKFGLCYRDVCDSCSVFVDSIDDVLLKTSRTVEEKLMDAVYNTHFGSIFKNLKFGSYYSAGIFILIAGLASLIVFVLTLSVLFYAYTYVKPVLDAIKLVVKIITCGCLRGKKKRKRK